MKKLIAAGLVVLLAGTVAYAQSGDNRYGDPITIEKITPLADILASPDEFVGKRVHTVGYVYSMCEEMGCWLGILPRLDSDKMVKIVWSHTDVRFPIGEETTGHYVEIEGEVITAEQEAEEHEAHMAAEGEMEHAEHAEPAEGEMRTIYVCPMHPDVMSETKDRCPICNMYLTEKEVHVPEFASISIKGIGAVVKEKK